MDRLDAFSVAAIVLLAGAMALTARSDGGPQPVVLGAGAVARAVQPAQLGPARNLLEANDVSGSEQIAREVFAQNPYDPEVLMLLGDIEFRKQHAVAAVRYYSRAVDLNPDYLDKKTPLFQGRKIRTAVQEALAGVEAERAKRPGDETLTLDKKMIHILQRRIAGSCG